MTTKKNFFTDGDIGLLILRITLGVIIFLHGWHKVQHGIANQQQLLENIGVPGVFMYFGYVSEVLAPVLLVLGIFTRFALIAIIITMIFAIPALPIDVMALGVHGEWVIEVQLFMLFVAVALFFTGPGRFCVRKNKSGNWLLD